MLLFTVQQEGNALIVTNGIGRFFILSDYDGINYLANEIIPCGYEEVTNRIKFALPQRTTLNKVAECYTINYGIKCFVGYTFADSTVICTNSKQFFKILND